MKCKFCGEELTYLERVMTGSVTHEFRLFCSDGGINTSYTDFNPDGLFEVYNCPNCGEEVADTEWEAIELLKEGD